MLSKSKELSKDNIWQGPNLGAALERQTVFMLA